MNLDAPAAVLLLILLLALVALAAGLAVLAAARVPPRLHRAIGGAAAALGAEAWSFAGCLGDCAPVWAPTSARAADDGATAEGDGDAARSDSARAEGDGAPASKGAAVGEGGVTSARSEADAERARGLSALVVDTLNLAHWLSPDAPDPAAAIAAAAPAIRAAAPRLSRLMFVLKGRGGPGDGAATAAAPPAAVAAARAAGAWLYYVGPPDAGAPGYPGGQGARQGTGQESQSHAAKARDDLYAAVLAARWRAPVLTEDRLRDFGEFRGGVAPFAVAEYDPLAPAGAPPGRDYVNPPALAGLRPPRALRFAAVPGLAAAKK